MGVLWLVPLPGSYNNESWKSVWSLRIQSQSHCWGSSRPQQADSSATAQTTCSNCFSMCFQQWTFSVIIQTNRWQKTSRRDKNILHIHIFYAVLLTLKDSGDRKQIFSGISGHFHGLWQVSCDIQEPSCELIPGHDIMTQSEERCVHLFCPWPQLDCMKDWCKTNFHPGWNIKAQTRYGQHMKGKPTKWVFRLFCVGTQ